MRRQPYSWPPSPTGDHSTHGKPNDSGRRDRSGTRSRQPQRRPGRDRGARHRQVVPHPRAPHRLAQGARGASADPRSSTASTARCATSPSTSTRASSSAIVGRNGSGKSSLLKILASIYRADAGRVRTAGRVAPFIELGVGFNPELTARENGVLNGVLMGLTLREARRSLDAGARVRRARGLRRPQAQELLVRDDGPLRVRRDGPGRRRHHADRRGARGRRRRVRAEVHGRLPRAAPRRQDDRPRHARHDHGADALPPGDAAPRRRAPLHRRARGRGAAVLPDELRRRGRPPAGPGPPAPRSSTSTRAWSTRSCAARPASGRDARRRARRSRSTCVLEAARALERPSFIFHVRNADGHGRLRVHAHGSTSASPRGRRVRLAGTVENPLVAGRYSLDVYIREDGRAGRHDRAGPAAAALRRSTGRRRAHGHRLGAQADVEPVLEVTPE